MSGPVLGLRGLTTWAIVGDVLNPSKPASRIASSIENQGRILYRISPTLDPKESSPKKRLYKKFADIPSGAKIDAVNLCVNYRIGLVVLEEMKRRGIKYCFFQPGADFVEIVEKADELGIVYQRGCMIVEPLLKYDEEETRAMEKKQEMLNQEGMESSSSCLCVVL